MERVGSEHLPKEVPKLVVGGDLQESIEGVPVLGLLERVYPGRGEGVVVGTDPIFHDVKGDPQGVDVSLGRYIPIGVVGQEDLRSPVRLASTRYVGQSVPALPFERAREAEVDELEAEVVIEHHVLRLDIPMDPPAFMDEAQSQHYFPEGRQEETLAETTAAHQVVEGPVLQRFQHQIVDLVPHLCPAMGLSGDDPTKSGTIGLDNIWVLELLQDLGLVPDYSSAR